MKADTMTDNFPLVSIILPVKNGARFLKQAMDTVVQQAYQPYELIVIDGHSVDQTAEIAQRYAGVRYLLQSVPGIGNGFNQGVAAAQGEYIAFLAHDDLWAPHKLHTQVAYMQAHPHVPYTVTRGKFFLEPGCVYPPSLPWERVKGEPIMRVLEALVARRSLFQQIGLFDPTMGASLDVEWFARANDLGVDMTVIDELLLYKRVHDANVSIYSQENTHHLLSSLRASVVRKRAMRNSDQAKVG